MGLNTIALGAAAALLAGAASAASAAAPGTKPAASPAATHATACDRACLVSLMNRWFAALAAHSAKGLPLARDVRFTEQAGRIPIGDGLFVSATQAPTTFKIIAADPVSGQVGSIAMMKQWDKPVLVSVRLKVAGGKITEAEQIIASDLRPNVMANLQTPRQTFLEDVPSSERTSRAKLYAAADAYFDAIEQDDGDFAPFAPDCTRHENGMQTTMQKTPQPSPIDAGAGGGSAMARIGSMSCGPQLNTHTLQYITMIRPRHLLVIDEQKGLVLGFPRFVHRGVVRVEKIAGVPGVASIPMNFGPMDLQASELFKIRGGTIHDIEATGFLNAYMAPTGWDDRYPERYRYAVTHPHTHPYDAGTTSAMPGPQPSSVPIR